MSEKQCVEQGENKIYDYEHKVYVSEVLLLDEDKKVVGVVRLATPKRVTSNSNILIKVQKDF